MHVPGTFNLNEDIASFIQNLKESSKLEDWVKLLETQHQELSTFLENSDDKSTPPDSKIIVDIKQFSPDQNENLRIPCTDPSCSVTFRHKGNFQKKK